MYQNYWTFRPPTAPLSVHWDLNIEITWGRHKDNIQWGQPIEATHRFFYKETFLYNERSRMTPFSPYNLFIWYEWICSCNTLVSKSTKKSIGQWTQWKINMSWFLWNATFFINGWNRSFSESLLVKHYKKWSKQRSSQIDTMFKRNLQMSLYLIKCKDQRRYLRVFKPKLPFKCQYIFIM